MNIFDTFFPINPLHILPFVKILALVLLLFHMVFSYVLVRQVQRMILVVEAQISPAFLGVAYAHLGASIFIFLGVLLLM